MIDLTTVYGNRVEQRLREDLIAWMTTIGPDSMPQPSPIWFLWNGTTFLIYSRPNTPKLRNIVHNPNISLNMNSSPTGGDIVVFTGQAALAPDAPPADQVEAYLAKYAQGIASLQMTPATFAQTYSVAIRVTPTRLRGF